MDFWISFIILLDLRNPVSVHWVFHNVNLKDIKVSKMILFITIIIIVLVGIFKTVYLSLMSKSRMSELVVGF